MGVTWINPYLAGPSASATYVNNYFDNVNRTTYTFNAIPVVPGLVVVAVHYEAALINSMTIDGISATTVVASPTTNLARVGFYSATTSTNGNISIQITFSTGLARCGIAVWQIFNQNSSTAVTTATNTGAPVSSLAVTLNDLSRAVVLGASTHGTGGTTHTWTGITEDYDVTLETTGAQMSGGDTVPNQFGSLTVETTYSANTDTATIAAIAYS